MPLTFRRLGPVMDRLPLPGAARLAALLGRGRVLVDAGGGTGRVARRVRGGFARAVVVDIERPLLARARGHGLDAVLADAAALPFRTGSVDAVLTVDAFHHFPDQAAALAEAARVRAPDGRVVLVEFDPGSVTGRLVELAERVAGFGSRFHRPDALAATVSRATGTAAGVERFNRRDYAVVASRETVSDQRR